MRLIVAAGALGAIVGALVGIAWSLDREEAPGLAMPACSRWINMRRLGKRRNGVG